MNIDIQIHYLSDSREHFCFKCAVSKAIDGINIKTEITDNQTYITPIECCCCGEFI